MPPSKPSVHNQNHSPCLQSPTPAAEIEATYPTKPSFSHPFKKTSQIDLPTPIPTPLFATVPHLINNLPTPQRQPQTLKHVNWKRQYLGLGQKTTQRPRV